MKFQHLFAATLLAVASLSASAQNQKPGLWEITNKMQSSNADLDDKMAKAREKMASLPPEQRKMMEDMMAKQGVSISANAGGAGMAVKMCLTKELMERNQGGAGMQRAGCTSSMSPRSGNTMKLTFTCTQPPSTGEGVYTFTSPESYTMHLVTNTTVQGKPAQMTMDATGKWLSSDCGNIKPISVPQ